MVWKDGSRYRGDWADDLPEGRGQYHWANGNSFVGQFRAGLPSGEGVFETEAGDMFVGALTDGLPNGRGSHIDCNYVEYRSSFQESLCTAKGRRSRISTWDSSGTECSMVGASTIQVTGASSQVFFLLF